MNRELLSRAIGNIDDCFIAEAYCDTSADAYDLPERSIFMKPKRLVTLAVAALLVLALGITAYAVYGVPKWTVTHAMENTGEYTSLDDLPEIEKITGYDICLVEGFTNGFRFSKLSIDGEAVYDEDYNVLKEYYSVHAYYSRAADSEILLSLSPVSDLTGTNEPPAPSSGCIVEGTEVKISRDHYKIVPEDYEKTEQDMAAEKAGHYYISFGSDSIKEMDNASAIFTLDDVEYCFLCSDATAVTNEMLISMASEIISEYNKG